MVEKIIAHSGYAGYTSDPQRGCGHKVRGGFYLEADFSSQGGLMPMSWVLGTQVEGRENLFTDTAQRAVTLVDIPATFMTLYVVRAGDDFPLIDDRMVVYNRTVDHVGTFGLLDYVGANHYTPFSFTDELYRYGPSRRVPRKIAKSMVVKLPLPVMFCHPDVPVFENNEAAKEAHRKAIALYGWDESLSTFYTPTWMHSWWGMHAERGVQTGSKHFMVPILRALNDDSSFLSDFSVEYMQMPFAMSWLTRISYVRRHSDDASGILGVIDIDLEENEDG